MLATLLTLCICPPQAEPGGSSREVVPPCPGEWRAWLDSPGGELPFGLVLDQGRDGMSGWVKNGEERSHLTAVRVEGSEIHLEFGHYDSIITAGIGHGGTELDGEWTKVRGPDDTLRMPFHARFGPQPRFAELPLALGQDPPPAPGLDPAARFISGRYAVQFEKDQHPAVGLLKHDPDGRLTGTFLTALGDYRYLEGTFDGHQLRLSCFDGAHAFLFHGVRRGPTLTGTFWSADRWREAWTGRLDPEAALPDPATLTRWRGGGGLGTVAVTDLEGRERRLDEPAFAGKPRVLVVMGSWCPNCNDEAKLMAELEAAYRDRGLVVLALAFELTGDEQRDLAVLRRFAERHAIKFPVFLAGEADKKKAAQALPMLDKVVAYPTTVFLHADDRVQAVHTGFAGPATGEAHRELRELFKAHIEAIVGQ
jgi:thiol-disulfide isomerase/thioredoxin